VDACRRKPLPLPPPSIAVLPADSMQLQQQQQQQQQEELAMGPTGDASPLSDGGTVPVDRGRAGKGLLQQGIDVSAGHDRQHNQQERLGQKRRRNGHAPASQAQQGWGRANICVDVVGATAVAAQAWAHHRQQIEQAGESEQQLGSGLQGTGRVEGELEGRDCGIPRQLAPIGGAQQDMQAHRSSAGDMSMSDEGCEDEGKGGPAAAARGPGCVRGLQPCHMLFWLMRDGVSESMDLQLPPAARKWQGADGTEMV